MSKKSLFSIYYYDGESDQVEVVAADELPTNEQARMYILSQVEGIDIAEWKDYKFIIVHGVYATSITDFNNSDSYRNVYIDLDGQKK